MKNKLLSILRIGISLFLIALLLWLFRKNLIDIWRAILGIKKPMLVLSVVVYFHVMVVMSYRLMGILRSRGLNLSLREVVYLTFVGHFFNNFLPTAIGGDVVKAYYTATHTKEKLDSYTSVFMDRVFGMLGLVVVAGTALIFVGGSIENRNVIYAIFGLFAGIILFLILLWSRWFARRFKFIFGFLRLFKLEQKIKRAYDAVYSFRDDKATILRAMCLSIFSQGLFAIMIWVLALGLSCEVRAGSFFLFVPIVGATAMLPSLNGLGIREGAFVYFFKDALTPEKAFAISLLYLAHMLAGSLIGGIIYMTKAQFRIKPAEVAE